MPLRAESWTAEPAGTGAELACRACGHPGREIFSKRGFRFARCDGCGSDFVCDPLPEAVVYDDTYFDARGRDGYSDYLRDQELILANFARRVRWIEPLARGKRLLDLGAAYGFLLLAAKRLGFDVLGIEPAAECARFARRELGVEILTGMLEDVDIPPASFDVITALDVIEHLPDPAAAMQRVRSWLRPGGVLAIETGDRDALLARTVGRRWYFYDPPQHLTFFTRASLAAMLARAGYSEPVAIGHLGRRVSLRNVSFQLGRAFGDGVLGRVSRGVSRSRLGTLCFDVPDRGNAFILAVRAGDGR